MCDLAAPLLVLIDDESLVYSCFVKLMQRITFQKGNKMDIRMDNLRTLIQVGLWREKDWYDLNGYETSLYLAGVMTPKLATTLRWSA